MSPITFSNEWVTHSRSILAGYRPEVLFGATVIVAGAGALGQNVMQNLALAGVGRLVIVDFDVFEAHNATRSPLFPTGAEVDRHGSGKAGTVARRLAAMATAPDPEVTYLEGLVQELDHRVIASADLIVAAVDSQSARAYLSEASRLCQVPIIEGGFAAEQFSMTLDSADWATACYRCGNPESIGSFSCTRYALEAEQRAIVPAIQNTAAVLGGLMAEAVIMGLHGDELTGTYNKLTGNIRAGRLTRTVVGADERCPGVHGEVAVSHGLVLDRWTFGALGEATRAVGMSSFRLLEPFVVEMSCQRCGARLRPLRPQSSWSRLGRCRSCDPASPYEPLDGLFLPLEYRDFQPEDVTALELDDVSLAAAGLWSKSRIILSRDGGGVATGIVTAGGALDDPAPVAARLAVAPRAER
jgi:molybdopterin/thiamine biosynthesis adenylyltransferase